MIKKLALDLHDQLFQKLRPNTLNVFLIGRSARYRQTLRDSIRSELDTKWLAWREENGGFFWKRMSVFYPEELFEELIRGKGRFDLLSLENLLARSVHAIVIVLESPGAIAELGAFANHSKLQDRLVVIVDRKFRKARSFIALGPIRYLAESTHSRVIYQDFRNLNLERLQRRLRAAIGEVGRQAEVPHTVENIVSAQYFLLLAIYVAEPTLADVLGEMIASLTKGEEREIQAVLHAARSILIKNGEVSRLNGKWRLTRLGLHHFMQMLDYAGHRSKTADTLDELRVRFLNSALRKNKGKFVT